MKTSRLSMIKFMKLVIRVWLGLKNETNKYIDCEERVNAAGQSLTP